MDVGIDVGISVGVPNTTDGGSSVTTMLGTADDGFEVGPTVGIRVGLEEGFRIGFDECLNGHFDGFGSVGTEVSSQLV